MEGFFMFEGKDIISLISRYLPPMSELAVLEKPNRKPAICLVDLDGDEVPEIAAIYKKQGEYYLIILKNYNGNLYTAYKFKGIGYNVNYFNVAPITGNNRNDLMVGWQIGGIWSQLDIFTWNEEGLKQVIQDEMYYSKVEIVNISSSESKKEKVSIALWKHDTAEAYKVEVYKYINGKLIVDEEIYPYYFKKVANYYNDKLKENPENTSYYYYLADSEMKAKMFKEALATIEKGLNLENVYPSKEKFLELKEEIIIISRGKVVNLYPATVKIVGGVKWGYINNKGENIIKPKYDSAYDFQDNGLAIVQFRNFYGIIDKHGKYLVKPKYDSINKFSEGRAVIVEHSGFGIIDEKGNKITKKNYNFIAKFQEGRALFNINVNEKNMYGYMDLNGQEVIQPIYETGTDFKDKRAVVKREAGQYELIGINGEILNKYNYDYVGNIGENLLVFQKKAGEKYGYMDEEGNVVLSPQYSTAEAFEQGRAIVNLSDNYINNYGVIDREGNFIIKPKYNSINFIGNNRFAVGVPLDKDKPYIGSKYAIVDKDGRFLTKFIYNSVSDYKHSLASAYGNRYTFFINKNGKVVKDLPIVSGSGILSYEEDCIKADVDFRLTYFNKDKEVIWSQNLTISLDNKYSVNEQKFKPNKDYLVYYPEIKGIQNKKNEKYVNANLKEISGVKHINSEEQLEYNYLGDYAVKFFRKNLVQIEFNGYKYYFGAAHGMPSDIYAHVDLVNGSLYQLKDLFKRDSNYVKVLSDIIEKQIKNDEKYSYIWQDSYKGIKEDQPFYVSEDALYIYFNPYEIAPYAAGFPTFKIPYIEIMSIIDVDGEFWKSFNYKV